MAELTADPSEGHTAVLDLSAEQQLLIKSVVNEDWIKLIRQLQGPALRQDAQQEHYSEAHCAEKHGGMHASDLLSCLRTCCQRCAAEQLGEVESSLGPRGRSQQCTERHGLGALRSRPARG